MVNTRSETAYNAAVFARDHIWVEYGMCLKWSRIMAGIPAKYEDAITSAHHAKLHPGPPPRGTFGYMRNRGSGEHGHIFIGAGGWDAYTTDFLERNHVERVDIRRIERGWNMEYIGWSDECNDVTLKPEPAPKPQPKPAPKPERDDENTAGKEFDMATVREVLFAQVIPNPDPEKKPGNNFVSIADLLTMTFRFAYHAKRDVDTIQAKLGIKQ